MSQYPLKLPALRIEQPLGIFYVASMPARVLLEVAYSDTLSASIDPSGVGYELKGTQRASQEKRLIQIADYLDRADAALPNSVILAANFRPDGNLEDLEADEDEPNSDSDKEWTVSQRDDGCFELQIPSGAKLAAIIDGQHRIFAFAKTMEKAPLDMDIVCSIFLDLPKPFQAQLFATINSTQKPVDRSLTYELFGYNIAEESEKFWTPDKLAVFLTRKLNTEPKSALHTRIVIAPKRDAILTAMLSHKGWKVSTAVVVDGILKLISSNPRRDTNELMSPNSKSRDALIGRFADKSPLREAYLSVNDNLIYTMVFNYLLACDAIFWSNAKEGSFIYRTAGVQALFGILRRLAKDAYNSKDISERHFQVVLKKAGEIDFSEDRFRNSSGSGRSYIRRQIEAAIGLS